MTRKSGERSTARTRTAKLLRVLVAGGIALATACAGAQKSGTGSGQSGSSGSSGTSGADGGGMSGGNGGGAGGW